MANENSEKPEGKGPLTDVRVQGFGERYANNVRFEASVWDLRLTFGTLDQAENMVGLHTAMNIPWSQAKLMLYYLFVHIRFEEEANGRIRVPNNLVPEPISKAIPRMIEEARGGVLAERIDQMREELFGQVDRSEADG